jgi:hypothetical protein
MTHMGLTCDIFRPFEMDFVETLSEQEYQKERAKAEQLAAAMRKKQAKK